MNFLSDEMRRNPFPAYARLRQTSPVWQDPRTGLWMIFDYDGVKRALNESEEFSSNPRAAGGEPTPQWMVFCDPPRHTVLRSLVIRAFTPRVVPRLQPRIRDLWSRLLIANAPREQCDLAA